MSETIPTAQPSLQSEVSTATPEAKAAESGRVVSIDALRGFDMFWIIGGQQVVLAFAALFHGDEIPGWLTYHTHHPAWEGFAAWDLIMPLFLFITGTSMPYSFAKRMAHGATKAELYRKLGKRVVVLFVLGMVVQGHLLDFDPSTLHIYCNTLQAIACGYCVAAIVLLRVGIRWQVTVALALLVAYWALMLLVPFGGHPAGTLQPDANLALAIDEFILGRFRDGTSYTWILSGLGFAATVLLGVLSGHVLRMTVRPIAKVLVLFGAGLLCLSLGWAWGNLPSPVQFPIIKHLWTSSMVLWSGGWCFLLMGGFYLVIDVMGLRRWAFPLVVIGMNSIAVYVAVHLIDFVQIADRIVGGIARFLGPNGQELLRQSSALLLIWLILLYLYRKRTFLRV
ncbi:MAG: acyltransferase family protein [Pirellulales bacterium]